MYTNLTDLLFRNLFVNTTLSQLTVEICRSEQLDIDSKEVNEMTNTLIVIV